MKKEVSKIVGYTLKPEFKNIQDEYEHFAKMWNDLEGLPVNEKNQIILKSKLNELAEKYSDQIKFIQLKKYSI